MLTLYIVTNARDTNARTAENMRRHGESKAHEKQKERIGAVLKARGWSVHIDDYPLECQTEKGPRTYWPDVYAQNFSRIQYRQIPLSSDIEAEASNTKRSRTARDTAAGARRIIVEVQGPKGHNSKAARSIDVLRLQDIRAQYGEMESYEVYLRSKKSKNDIRNWTEQDIAEELRL